jgi:hypothetical protein
MPLPEISIMATSSKHAETYTERLPRRSSKSPYFLQPAQGGGVTVLRRPSGNRAVPKDCGTMPSQAQAQALVRQLQRAESVLKDLFLEATDDGIEALEAVLQACRTSVLQAPAGSARSERRRGRGRRRHT